MVFSEAEPGDADLTICPQVPFFIERALYSVYIFYLNCIGESLFTNIASSSYT